MARIRSIKPEMPQSESLGRVSRDARLLFVMLWPICDDHGRTRAASRMLASLLFPYDNDAPQLINGWLDELEHEDCIRRYVIEGTTYLYIPKWLTHQKIDKPSKPIHPDPPEYSPKAREDSPNPHPRKGREGKGVEGSGGDPRPPAGSRLPTDWQPSETELRWARDARPDIDANAEIEKFRDFWTAKPGKDGRKADWPATWRNWIRNAKQWGPRAPEASAGPGASRVRQLL